MTSTKTARKKSTRSPGRLKRDAAVAEVRRWESTIVDWRTRRGVAVAALEKAQAETGERILEDPARSAKLAGEIRDARDGIGIADKAIEAAQLKLNAARVAVLELEASRLDRSAEMKRTELDAHNKRTVELLDQLEAHECTYVPERQWVRALSDAGRPLPESWSAPRSLELEQAVEQEATRADVLRDVAAGVDPAVRLRELADVSSTVHGLAIEELYPPVVWGPDAVLPAPAFLRAVENAQRLIDDHDAELAVDDTPEIERRQAVIDEIDEKEATGRASWHRITAVDVQRRDARKRWIAARRKWREEAPDRRKSLVDALHKLTGGRDLAGG